MGPSYHLFVTKMALNGQYIEIGKIGRMYYNQYIAITCAANEENFYLIGVFGVSWLTFISNFYTQTHILL